MLNQNRGGRPAAKAARRRRIQARAFGRGPALSMLGALVLAAGCGTEDPPAASSAAAVPLGVARAALVTNSVFEVSGDTFVREGGPNENYGAGQELSVQTDSRHRALLFFDIPALKAAVGAGTVLSARIDLFISANPGGWGTGRAIAIHALRQASSEAAATWACASDADTANQTPDCSGESAWNMSGSNAVAPFAPAFTSAAVIANGTQGVVSFNVTPDVLAIMSDLDPGHGWLIKKMDELAPGALRFASREQGPAARLTLMVEMPDPCTKISDTDATCDGQDDDCDGFFDEDFVSGPATCGVGACASTGTQSCAGGVLRSDCQPLAPAADDASCDGIDDDCDGVADEDHPSVPTTCGVGACAAEGATSCVSGQIVDSCGPGAPAALDALCDGVDEDCDGVLDEDFVPGCEGASTVTCSDGALVHTSCSDGDVCNGAESCAGAAECVAGTPPSVQDEDPCTVDACDPVQGVLHSLAPVGTVCGSYRACDPEGQCVSLLPPDPVEVAPVLGAADTSFLDRVRFLYEGPAPIQTGVTPGAIQSRSAAVLRGRVLGPDGAPLPQVAVTVHGHPEYGQTLSRLDGGYDLVVNGGGPLTVRFERDGSREAQRTLQVPWQDYSTLDDLALTAEDAESTELLLPTTAPVLHRSSRGPDGSRLRVFVSAGTSASFVLADGSVQPAPALSLRATRLGGGASGTLALPALLPETAAGALALELSAEQADAAQAVRVELSEPAALYVDGTTLGLPVGTALPVGLYDRRVATWLGQPSGRVLELLGVEGGLAVLDVDGGGAPAPLARLEELGVGDDERAQLALAFAPGDVFFRIGVDALGPYGVGLPFGAEAGGGGVADLPAQLDPLDDATLPRPAEPGPVLAQRLPLAGTALTLRHDSDRTPGDTRGRRLQIPVFGASLGSTLVGGFVDIQIAGQRHLHTVAPNASSVVDFVWDGHDVAGRPLQGWHRAQIRVGAVVPMSYLAPDEARSSFAHTAFGAEPIGAAPEPHVSWTRHERLLYRHDGRQTGIGGWGLEQHHRHDPKSRVVHLGDGSSFPTRTSSTIIDRFAGVPQSATVGAHTGDGGPARSARMDSPRAVAVAPDGSLFIATRRGVRRVDAVTGVITTVTGRHDLTSCDPSLTEGPALELCVFARTLDFGRDGALYMADVPEAAGGVDRIRRLDLATGLISHVAGVQPTAGCANMGDGGPAREAALCSLTAHASAPDGSIYLLDRGNAANPLAIRKISTDGIIDTIGAARWTTYEDVAALAVGPDGSVYVTQIRSVLRILPTGEVKHFAGNTQASGNAGEGGPALLARFGNNGPGDVSVDADGRVFIGDTGNAQIRMVDQQGIIRRVAGTTASSVNGDGGSPLRAALGRGVVRSSLGPDGSLFITARSNHTVRVVRPSITGDFAGQAVVPSPDGAELYRFAADGRHLDTRDAATGALLRSFAYDDAQLLASVTDASGTTTIERDAEGRPTAIVAPLGEVTLLDTDADGFLSEVVGPGGEHTHLEHTRDGLLVRRVDPDGSEHVYSYDADGQPIVN